MVACWDGSHEKHHRMDSCGEERRSVSWMLCSIASWVGKKKRVSAATEEAFCGERYESSGWKKDLEKTVVLDCHHITWRAGKAALANLHFQHLWFNGSRSALVKLIYLNVCLVLL